MSTLTHRIRRFERILALARANERRAGLSIRAAEKTLRDERERLQQLHAYQVQKTDRPLAAPEIANRARFGARLRDAIEQQGHTVGGARRALTRARQGWAEARQNSEKYKMALATLAEEQSTSREKELRRTLDEFALRRYSARRQQPR